MTCHRDTRGRDRSSILLLVISSTSLSAAMAMAVSPASAKIPDHLLDRVRGSNPAWARLNAGTCNSLNVAAANWPFPPTPPYVDNFSCGAILNQPCITCLLGTAGWNYNLIANNGTAAAAIPKPYGIVYCNPSPSGTLGKCVGGTCYATGVWNCSTNATYYGLQQ